MRSAGLMRSLLGVYALSLPGHYVQEEFDDGVSVGGFAAD